MTPERWEQIGEVYHAALEMDLDARMAFLDRACGGDVALREEVESLLSAAENAGDFIDSPPLPNLLGDAAKIINDEPPLSSPDRARIGRFAIKSLLGSGGMGKVYLAQDTRLGRRVAIKVLSPEVADDQTARRRMLREARSVAALNHPNIVTIYSIEEDGDSVCIVMEYIRGETLTSRIKSNGLKFAQVLDIGVKVADALAAAHSAGLVHRDIKPSNIIITADGQVKLLDFGIVKISKSPLSDGGAGDPQLTADGDILGTINYMSPEQARSEKIDSRSDIFSLGAMLYEAATGRLPFNGPNSLLIAHEIIEAESPPPSSINPDLPGQFDRIIKRALAKDRDRRYQSASEFAAALMRLKRNLAESSDRHDEIRRESSLEHKTSEQRATPRTNIDLPVIDSAPARTFITLSRKTAFAITAIALLIIASLAFVAFKSLNRDRAAAIRPVLPGIEATILTNTGNVAVARAAISPDGKYAAYVVQESHQTHSLWVRQLDAFSGVRVIAPDDVEYGGVTFTKDGRQLYYAMRKRQSSALSLYLIPLLGGVSKKVIDDVDGPISLSPDGRRFVFRRYLPEQNERALFVANSDGGGEIKIASSKAPESFGDPAWSPDGKVIVCSSGHADGGANRYIVEIEAGNWRMRRLPGKRWRWVGSMEWLSDGKGLLMIASETASDPYRVWRLSYPDGEAVRVTDNVIPYTRLSLSADSGSLLVSQLKRNTNLWIINGAEPNIPRKITFGGGGFRGYLSWISDGKLMSDSETTGIPDISMIDDDGGNQEQLFADLTGKAIPVSSRITPDGRFAIFGYDQTGTRHIWRMNINGRDLVQITNGSGEDHPYPSPDGKWIVYTSIGSQAPVLWKVPIYGGQPIQLTTSRSGFPAVSPDGKLIACYYAGESADKRSRLALIPFAGGEPVRIFPQALYTGHPPKWTPDGRYLTYTDESQTNIWLQPIDGGEPKRLTDFSNDLIFGYEWSPDGRRLACVRGIWQRDLVLIKNFR